MKEKTFSPPLIPARCPRTRRACTCPGARWTCRPCPCRSRTRSPGRRGRRSRAGSGTPRSRRLWSRSSGGRRCPASPSCVLVDIKRGKKVLIAVFLRLFFSLECDSQERTQHKFNLSSSSKGPTATTATPHQKQQPASRSSNNSSHEKNWTWICITSRLSSCLQCQYVSLWK